MKGLIEIIQSPPAEIKQYIEEHKVDVNAVLQQGTLLHEAVRAGQLPVIELLLAKGAKTYLTDEKFQTPFDVAKSKASTKILEKLIANRTPVAQKDLDSFMLFCQEHYQGEEKSRAQDKGLLDYAVSCLTGMNVSEILKRNENWMRYTAHLTDFQEVGKLEGWCPKEFLPLRIRAIFEILIRMSHGLIDKRELPAFEAKRDDAPADLVSLLRRELLVELETLQAYQVLRIVTNKNEPILVKSLAKNIAGIIDKFHQNELSEYCLSSGWSTHALYISFIRDGSTIIVRIDNLGSESERYHEGADKHFYPYIIGKINQKGFKPTRYLERLIQAESENKETAAAYIYDKSRELENVTPVSPEQLGHPASHQQKGNTCVVINHNVGLQIRLKEPVYQWFLTQEMQVLGRLAYQPALDLQPFWAKYRQPRAVPLRVQRVFKEHHQKQANIRLLLNIDGQARELPLEQSYINLAIVKERPLNKKAEPNPDEKGKDAKSASKEGEADVEMSDRNELLQRDETFYKQTEPVKVVDLFRHCPEGKKQVIVGGQPGIGKSTFCHYVLQQWASDKLWAKEHGWVFLIPLRHLTADRYPILPARSYTEADIVQRECFPAGAIPVWAEDLFKKSLEQDSNLWILDGYDELPDPLPAHLQALLKKLYQKPQLIITSRSHLAQKASQETGIPTCLEIIGFRDEEIEAYIKNFFNSSAKENKEDGSSVSQGNKLLDALRSNPNLWSIAHVPINLELICSIWMKDAKSLLNLNNVTLSELYHKITFWLLRRCLQKGMSSGESEIPESTLARRFPKELWILEKLAFKLMQENKLFLPSSVFVEEVPEIKNDESLYIDILSMGLLRSESNKKSDCFFIHLTFQEYFAARYLVRNLQKNQTSSEYQRAYTFIRNEKYNTRYRIMLGFTAGLLSRQKDDKGTGALRCFWKALEAEPRECFGLNHLELIMHCLNESYRDARVPRREEYLKQLNEIVVKEIQRDGAEGTLWEHLLSLIKTNSHISIAVDPCLLENFKLETVVRLQALEVLQALGPRLLEDKAILLKVVARLDGSVWEGRTQAVKVLHSAPLLLVLQRYLIHTNHSPGVYAALAKIVFLQNSSFYVADEALWLVNQRNVTRIDLPWNQVQDQVKQLLAACRELSVAKGLSSFALPIPASKSNPGLGLLPADGPAPMALDGDSKADSKETKQVNAQSNAITFFKPPVTPAKRKEPAAASPAFPASSSSSSGAGGATQGQQVTPMDTQEDSVQAASVDTNNNEPQAKRPRLNGPGAGNAAA